MATVTEQIEAFMTEYNSESEKLTSQLDRVVGRLSDVKMEIDFIQTQEIPKATERRVLTGDVEEEKKLRRSLEKLETERQSLQEEQAILSGVLPRFRQEKADQATKLQTLLQEESRLVADTQYRRMQLAKDQYIAKIKEESRVLHIYRDLDLYLQAIEVDGGRKKDVYAEIPIRSATRDGETYRNNGVYLPISFDEVRAIIKAR